MTEVLSPTSLEHDLSDLNNQFSEYAEQITLERPPRLAGSALSPMWSPLPPKLTPALQTLADDFSAFMRDVQNGQKSVLEPQDFLTPLELTPAYSPLPAVRSPAVTSLRHLNSKYSTVLSEVQKKPGATLLASPAPFTRAPLRRNALERLAVMNKNCEILMKAVDCPCPCANQGSNTLCSPVAILHEANDNFARTLVYLRLLNVGIKTPGLFLNGGMAPSRAVQRERSVALHEERERREEENEARKVVVFEDKPPASANDTTEYLKFPDCCEKEHMDEEEEEEEEDLFSENELFPHMNDNSSQIRSFLLFSRLPSCCTLCEVRVS